MLWFKATNPPKMPAFSLLYSTPLTTEDVVLIESLEESKRVATEINEKVAEAKETEVGGAP